MENEETIKVLKRLIRHLLLERIAVKGMINPIFQNDPNDARLDGLFQIHNDLGKYIQEQEQTLALVQDGTI